MKKRILSLIVTSLFSATSFAQVTYHGGTSLNRHIELRFQDEVVNTDTKSVKVCIEGDGTPMDVLLWRSNFPFSGHKASIGSADPEDGYCCTLVENLSFPDAGRYGIQFKISKDEVSTIFLDVAQGSQDVKQNPEPTKSWIRSPIGFTLFLVVVFAFVDLAIGVPG